MASEHAICSLIYGFQGGVLRVLFDVINGPVHRNANILNMNCLQQEQAIPMLKKFELAELLAHLFVTDAGENLLSHAGEVAGTIGMSSFAWILSKILPATSESGIHAARTRCRFNGYRYILGMEINGAGHRLQVPISILPVLKQLDSASTAIAAEPRPTTAKRSLLPKLSSAAKKRETKQQNSYNSSIICTKTPIYACAFGNG
ncbi:hypothetical protein Tco_1385388 [Tanacetum coccineum]